MKRDRIGAWGRYLLGLLLTVFLYFATGSRWILALVIFLLLLPPVSLGCSLYIRKKLRIRLQLPTTSPKGTACLGCVELENKAWLPVPKLYCKVGLVNDLTREEAVVEMVCALGPGRKGRREFLLESACCGRVYAYLQRVQIMDLFGLLPLNVTGKASARITVLPELFSCDVSAAPASAISDDSVASKRGDDRTEVFQLREYQSGDDIRQIHWKLSSKLDALIFREPSQSISRSMLVFWDKREECTPETMDAMAEVTASACQGLCDSGQAFDLCWTEKEELQLREIRDGDTFLTTIPALVTQAGSPECPKPAMEDYGRVILITSRLPEEESNEDILYLVCTEEEYGDGRNLCFTPENYREQLERLEL